MLTFDSKFYLHINGTAMGIIFGPTLQMGHHEINVYSVIYQSYPLASKYFENSQFRFLDDCQILNQISNIQVTMEKSQTRVPFLDIMINQSDRKIWMNIYNKPTDTKKIKKVPFTKKHPWHYLTNIPSYLARRIFTTAGCNKNVFPLYAKLLSPIFQCMPSVLDNLIRSMSIIY